MSQRRSSRRRKRQAGAVLVEGVIVAASLVCLFGCMLSVQQYCSLKLQQLDDAREEAWRRAMAGCTSDEPVLADMARELMSGEFPFPDGIVPSMAAMKFVCNPRPSSAKPLTNMAGWVFELFRG